MAFSANIPLTQDPHPQHHEDPPYFQFPRLSELKGVVHGVFTRQGGVSAPPFESLNTSLGVGDDPQAVAVNRARIQRCLKAPAMIFPRQEHGCRVVAISASAAEGSPPQAAPRADALITRCPGRFLAIQVADCQAVLIADPVAGVIANIHAGWRGTTANIVSRAIRTMEKTYGCQPRNLRAGISPSLGPCCAEFINYKNEIPQALWRYKDSRHHFDFWAITRDQMAAEGVRPENINASELCTRCHSELFFSYRAAQVTGRFSAVIGLRPN